MISAPARPPRDCIWFTEPPAGVSWGCQTPENTSALPGFKEVEMGRETIRICCTINSRQKTIDIPSHLTALELLRDILKLKGTKEGCGIGECGACTIQVDGKAVNACLMLAAQLDGRNIVTIEGLGESGKLHPLQESFGKNHAVQCGFCTPGLIMSAKALLDENPSPNRAQISKAIAGNLCRCTGYQQIFSSIEDAIQGGSEEGRDD